MIAPTLLIPAASAKTKAGAEQPAASLEGLFALAVESATPALLDSPEALPGAVQEQNSEAAAVQPALDCLPEAVQLPAVTAPPAPEPGLAPVQAPQLPAGEQPVDLAVDQPALSGVVVAPATDAPATQELTAPDVPAAPEVEAPEVVMPAGVHIEPAEALEVKSPQLAPATPASQAAAQPQTPVVQPAAAVASASAEAVQTTAKVATEALAPEQNETQSPAVIVEPASTTPVKETARTVFEPVREIARPADPQAVRMVHEQLRGTVVRMVSDSQGNKLIKVRLHPEELGPVTVKATFESTGVRIELIPATDSARESVKAALHDLRRDLLAHNSDATLDMGDDRPESHSEKQTPHHRSSPRAEHEPAPESPRPSQAPATSEPDHLDRSV